MARWLQNALCCLILCIGIGAMPQASHLLADGWDLHVQRLYRIKTKSGKFYDGGGSFSSLLEKDPLDKVYPDNAAFRSLMSELGVVFAPNMLSPSDTPGFSGFSVATELGWTSINPFNTATDSNIGVAAPYWRAAESVSASSFPTGELDKDPIASERMSNELPPGFAPTLSFVAHKGLWFPVPSVDLGVGIRHLIGSRMWAPTVSAKIALHEGFHRMPLPSFAIRGSGARLLGTSGFNLSLASLDFSLSKRVGVASLLNVSPYLGYQLLWIAAAAETLDATPGIDAIQEMQKTKKGNEPYGLNRCEGNDCNGFFTFANQSNITRHRFFAGIKANMYLVFLTLEYTYFVSGLTSAALTEQADMDLPGITIPDSSGAQHSLSFALGMDY